MFIPFVNPVQLQDLVKYQRWIVACSRKVFTAEENISRNTYGPTEEFSDSLEGNLTLEQASRSSKKRKAPATRVM